MTFHFSTLKRIHFISFLQLLLLLIFNPLKTYVIMKATLQTEKIVKKKFPKSHGSNKKGNAFKHILWNVFIVKNLTKINAKSPELFTEKFTTLYEKTFVNAEKFSKMDLHNNQLGILIFKKIKNTQIIENENNIINYIENSLSKSIYY